MNTWIMNPPPALQPNQALFLDFDGTLVDIADSPEQIKLRPVTCPILLQLLDFLDGAVAVISGRTVANLQHYLPLEDLTLVGVHGAQRRMPGSTRTSTDSSARLPAQILQQIRQRLRDYPQLYIEDKTHAIAVHWRTCTQHQDVALSVMREIAKQTSLKLVCGDAVAELHAHGIGKDVALENLMQQAPFRGRKPVMFGDDEVDEPAFASAVRLGGWGVKTGTHQSQASYRMSDPQHWHTWMQQQLEAHDADAAVRQPDLSA